MRKWQACPAPCASIFIFPHALLLSTASSRLNADRGEGEGDGGERDRGGDSGRQGLQRWRTGRGRGGGSAHGGAPWPLTERCLACHRDAARMVMRNGKFVCAMVAGTRAASDGGRSPLPLLQVRGKAHGKDLGLVHSSYSPSSPARPPIYSTFICAILLLGACTSMDLEVFWVLP